MWVNSFNDLEFNNLWKSSVRYNCYNYVLSEILKDQNEDRVCSSDLLEYKDEEIIDFWREWIENLEFIDWRSDFMMDQDWFQKYIVEFFDDGDSLHAGILDSEWMISHQDLT